VSDIERDLTDTKRQLIQIENKKIEVATRLKTLDEEKEKIVKECTLLNVNPKEIELAITALEEDIQKDILQLKASLETFSVS
jgi:chromosome segregation ATPase